MRPILNPSADLSTTRVHDFGNMWAFVCILYCPAFRIDEPSLYLQVMISICQVYSKWNKVIVTFFGLNH